MNHALQSQEKAQSSPSRSMTSTTATGRRLSVGEANASLEREADHAASTILSEGGNRADWSLSSVGITAPLQRKCSCHGGGTHCEECKKKEKDKEHSDAVHRRADDSATPSDVPAIVYEVLKAPGRPLDKNTRTFFESRFGHDFSRVRVHTDARAAESARAIKAQAYTHGQDIIFAQGKYAPETAEGKNLLAHELAHTLQHRGVQRPGAKPTMGQGAEHHRMEHEARSAASAVSLGKPPKAPRPATKPTISRAADTPTMQTQKAALAAAGYEEMDPPPQGVSGIRRFRVKEMFPMPKKKGPNAEKVWRDRAHGGGLESFLDATNEPKSVLKQERPPTVTLRSYWLSKVGWSPTDAPKKWKGAGGDSASFDPPKAGKATCDMDHIIELQVGGTNVKENVQVLDLSDNRSSGGLVRGYLVGKGKAVKDIIPGMQELILHWDDVTPTGDPSCGKCCEIEGKLSKPVGAGAEPSADQPPSEGTKIADRVPISAGGSSTEILIPEELKKTGAVPIKESTLPENKSAATLISGLTLLKLNRSGKAKTIEAEIDATSSRIPIILEKGRGSGLEITVGHDGVLTIPKKTAAIAFTYPYLSPGQITKIAVDESGAASWSGTINPKIPILGPFGVEYANGSLKVTKGLDEDALKKKSVLGMRVTKAQVNLQLAPEFKPEGVIEMQMGAADNPLAQASLNLSADSIGLVAVGKLKCNVPKMKTAETDISYKGGGERNEWAAEIHIKSEDIQIPSATVSGQFDGKIQKDGMTFTGEIDATFPGDNSAKLGLEKTKDDWLLFGKGKFNVPKLDPVNVDIKYSLVKERLVATGSTGFTIPSLNLHGHLDHATIVLEKDLSFKDAKISGTGGLDFERHKAKGHLNVTLHPNGKFSGKGDLTYKLKENLIVTGTVELSEEQKLRVGGELEIPRYELFGPHGDHKDLLSLDIPIPVPGLSIGTTGVVFHIRGGVGIAYSFGPGVIEPLKFSAQFDPLEANPNAEFTVTGTVKVPASATLSASVTGSLAVQVDVFVGSAGAEGGVTLQGDLILSAGAFAKLDAAYKAQRLTAKVEAGLETKLLLGLSLTAFARAWAGAFGISGEVRKDWTLARKVVDTGVDFYMSAPFEYAEDTGVKLPEMKDITIRKPSLNFEHIVSQIFGSAQTREKQS